MDKKIAVLIAVALAVVGLFVVFKFLGLLSGGLQYVCPDGTVVSEPAQCPTSTTALTRETTTFAYTTAATRATTRATTVRSTTTTMLFECSSDLDCGFNVNSTPYCSDDFVKVDVLKPVCLNSGRANSRCALTPTGISHVLDECEPFEFCLKGQCILRSCVNRKHDSNEEKIDCGGSCPDACNEFSILCNNNNDCGEMKCVRKYFCLGTNPAYNCSYGECLDNGTVNSKCINATTSVVNEVCGQGEHCVEGREVCINGGSCRDCVRNQDELDVDCGGESCRPCAVIPDSYDFVFLSGSNSFRAEYVDMWGNSYIFFLEKILKYKEDCVYGAKISLDNPKDGTRIESFKQVDRYSNTTIHKFTIGLLNMTTSSAAIWIVEPE